jgi:hypothetical protein
MVKITGVGFDLKLELEAIFFSEAYKSFPERREEWQVSLSTAIDPVSWETMPYKTN